MDEFLKFGDKILVTRDLKKMTNIISDCGEYLFAIFKKFKTIIKLDVHM